MKYPFSRRIKVPKGILDADTEWLNASGKIIMEDLRGKIVILDFWTYCCINCMHVLPDLKYLEQKYPNELVVIGVHSAKFENEKDAENIRRAIQRYEIEHPVVNDSEMVIWRRFGARAWPTLFVVDAEGHACFMTSGEGQREVLEYVVEKLIEYHKATGTLDRAPVRFDLELSKLTRTPLRFPGKVLADAKSGRLFVADTNHNRVVVSTLDGKLIDVIGSGSIGATDGDYAAAEFHHPHGMALVGETLYVCDTKNHFLRAVDLENKSVSTLAGTGKQGRPGVRGGDLKSTPLNSPWSVVHLDGVLYVAMAGSHQLWHHELGSDYIELFAGSGREDLIDGPRLEAALAQPSGITTDGKNLYFVDSEASAVRVADRGQNGEVTTLIGPVDEPLGRLFEFGDVDGIGTEARLQHPIGITWHDGALYVVDTYNHKVKKVEPAGKGWKSATHLGTGRRGGKLDPPQFFEPEGISVAAGRLYIADTNNHRICVADLSTGKVSELKIDGLKPPEASEAETAEVAAAGKTERVPAQRLASSKTLDFAVNIKLPEGYKLNTLLPVTYRLKAEQGRQLLNQEHLDERREAEIDGSTARIRVPLQKTSGEALLELSLSFGYCRGGRGGLCKIHASRWSVPVTVSADGTKREITLTADATK